MEMYQSSIFDSLIHIVSENQTLAKIIKEQCILYGFSKVTILPNWKQLFYSLFNAVPDIIISDRFPDFANSQIPGILENRNSYYESLPVILYSPGTDDSEPEAPAGLTIVALLHEREEQQRLLEVIHEELEKNILDLESLETTPVATHLNILAITKDARLSSGIRKSLQHEGYYVSIINNGQDAVTYIQGISPHVVLLDYDIPQLSGLSLFYWIRENFPELAVIITADSQAPELAAELLRSGVRLYLPKPFDFNMLPSLCRAALKKSRKKTPGQEDAGSSETPSDFRLEAQELEELRMLKKSEENFKTLVNASRDLIFRITPQGILNFASPAVEEQLGYTREDLEEEHINVSKFVHALDLIRVMAGIRQVIRGSSIQGLECRLMHKDKIRFRWYSINCYPMYNSRQKFVGVGGIARDIVSIKEFEEKTQKQNERLSALNSIAGIVNQSLDLNEILHKVINQVLEIMRFQTGSIFLKEADSEALALQSCQTVLAGSNSLLETTLLKVCSDCKSLKEKVFETAAPMVVPNIGSHPELRDSGLVEMGFRSLISIPLNSKDLVLGILILLIEEQRQLNQDDLDLLTSIGNQIGMAVDNISLYQQELKARERLEELNKLKDDFVAIVSHDLRSPLTAILGASEILLSDEYMDPPLPEDQRELVVNIQDMGEQQLHLVNDLLDLAKIESGKLELHPTVTHLGSVVTQCYNTLKVLAENKNISLKTGIVGQIPKIMLDVPKINQVINNLVSNAIKFTAAGGEVTIQVEKDDEFVKISVTDTGEGIKPEELQLLFNKFQQLKAHGTGGERGTGLGLSICKNLVELHEGKIWAESQPGVGSTFAFTLPMTDNVILVIDDSLVVVKSLEKILLEHVEHITVKYALSGTEGLKLTEELSPVVVILDYMMPDMDGVEVFRRLRQRMGNKMPPTIFLTASQDLDVRHDIFDLGAADYLQKPVDVNDLLPRLSRFL
ncbi:MAG: response regulator [bacterium]|nr:response regulator [bacterium]